jgi:CDGSH-type Zn-finger protein
MTRSAPVSRSNASAKPVEAPAATVTVYPDGPLVVRGDVEIRTVDGEALETPGKVVALCRCGKSRLKPFCDSSHKFGRGLGDPGARTSPRG